MTTLTYIILFSLIGGLVSISIAALFLSKRSISDKFALYATPFAAGALLAAVFLDLLPEGLHESAAEDVLLSALIAILLFFIAERLLRWFHHHHQHDGADPSVPLIVTGDTVHNAIDGVVIAAAFLVSIPTGIVATFAVAAHEIPQEVGDFGLLLKKGVRRRNVFIINILSSLATVVAAVITYAVGSAEQLPLGIILGIGAGFLLYIALSDIIPGIHESPHKKGAFDLQPLLLLAGVLVVGLAIQLAHGYIDAGHGSETAEHSMSEEHDESHEDDHHDEEKHLN